MAVSSWRNPNTIMCAINNQGELPIHIMLYCNIQTDDMAQGYLFEFEMYLQCRQRIIYVPTYKHIQIRAIGVFCIIKQRYSFSIYWVPTFENLLASVDKLLFDPVK